MFPNYKQDQGHAEKLGIVNYPALYLASPNGQFAVVSQGIQSLPGAEHRILVAALKQKWITKREYDSTRSLSYSNTNIAEILSQNFKPIVAPSKGVEDNYIPPKELLNRIEKTLQVSYDR